jgi:hypothetical protein
MTPKMANAGLLLLIALDIVAIAVLAGLGDVIPAILPDSLIALIAGALGITVPQAVTTAAATTVAAVQTPHIDPPQPQPPAQG